MSSSILYERHEFFFFCPECDQPQSISFETSAQMGRLISMTAECCGADILLDANKMEVIGGEDIFFYYG